MADVVLKPKSNFELLRKNPQPVFLKPESTKVNVEIKVTTKKPNSAKTDRWTQVAEKVMEEYRDIVEDTVEKVTSKWEGMSKSEREKSAATLSTSINNAYRSMEGAIEKAVAAQIKREAQGDQNLLEARIAVAVKGTFKVISIAENVTELVVTGGASVKAWVSLAKDIYALAKMIHDQCKDEPKLKEELLKSIGTYCSTKQRRFDEAQKAQDWKAKAKLYAKQIWASEKSLAGKAEEARKKYRNEVTSMTQTVDKLGSKKDALLALLRKSGDDKNAKDIVKGAEMIDLGKKVGELNGLILSCQKFLDDMAYLLTENGVEVDDRTAVQKLRSIDGLKSMAKVGKEIYDAASSLKSIIEAIEKAV